MTEEELKQRTKMFARRIILLVQTLPENTAGRALGSQLIRSGTSVAANCRAACRAKSKADFIGKVGTLEEEADESALWLDLLILKRIASSPDAGPLKAEAEGLTAIAVASILTARGGPRSNSQSAIRNPQ